MGTFLILSIILLGANSVFWPVLMYRHIKSIKLPDNQKLIDGIEQILSRQKADSLKAHQDIQNLFENNHRDLQGLFQDINQIVDDIEFPEQDNSVLIDSLNWIVQSLDSLDSELKRKPKVIYKRKRKKKQEPSVTQPDPVQIEALEEQPVVPQSQTDLDLPASELKVMSESLRVLAQAEQKRLDEAEYMRQRRIEGRKIAAASRNQKQPPIPERFLTWGTIPGSSGLIPPKNYKES